MLGKPLKKEEINLRNFLSGIKIRLQSKDYTDLYLIID